MVFFFYCGELVYRLDVEWCVYSFFGLGIKELFLIDEMYRYILECFRIELVVRRAVFKIVGNFF